MKKFMLGLVCGITLTASSVVYASDTIQAYLFPVKYFFNGQEKELSSEYTTLNYNGHAYVPVRFIAESMGASVEYFDESSAITINWPLVVQYRKDHDIGIPNIEGYVTKVENQRILVVSPKQQDFSATGGVKEFYSAVWVSNVPKDIKVGQQVQVWFQGLVLSSYPGQAMADKISFKPNDYPHNASLSEEQVVHQAIRNLKYADIKIFVLKEVKYDESTDNWVIRFKDGMLNSYQDQEHILQIADKYTKTDTKESYSANLTDNEAKDILSRLIPKAENFYGMFNGTGWFKVDVAKTIPGETGYAQVIDEKFNSIADLKKAVEEVITKDCAEIVFYSRYLTPDKGDRPLYKDYGGKLYNDTQNGGHGWATKFLIDTAKVKSQKDHVAEIELETTVLDEPSDKLTIRIEYVNNKWLLASRLDI